MTDCCADFRFNPHTVRRAGLPSVPYAKALRALWEDTRTPRDMRRVFGDRVVSYLARAGYISEEDGVYRLTAAGVEVLTACGYPPIPQRQEEASRV